MSAHVMAATPRNEYDRSPPSSTTRDRKAPQSSAMQEAARTRPYSAGIVELHNSFAIGKALSENAAAAEARVDELCEKSRRVRKHEAPAGGADAAEFMASGMDYEKPLDQPPGSLHLPDDLRNRIRSYGDAWLQRITDADLAGLDFFWLLSSHRPPERQ